MGKIEIKMTASNRFSALSWLLFPVTLAICTIASNVSQCLAQDQKDLEGKWLISWAEEKGQKLKPKDLTGDTYCSIKGDRLTLVDEGRVGLEFRYKIDSSKTPSEVDLIDLNGKGVNHGIIKIEKGDLYICVSNQYNPNQAVDRPIAFTTDRQMNKNLQGLVLAVYKKDLPKK